MLRKLVLINIVNMLKKQISDPQRISNEISRFPHFYSGQLFILIRYCERPISEWSINIYSMNISKYWVRVLTPWGLSRHQGHGILSRVMSKVRLFLVQLYACLHAYCIFFIFFSKESSLTLQDSFFSIKLL